MNEEDNAAAARILLKRIESEQYDLLGFLSRDYLGTDDELYDFLCFTMAALDRKQALNGLSRAEKVARLEELREEKENLLRDPAAANSLEEGENGKA